MLTIYQWCPRRGRIVSASFDLKSEIMFWSKMWQGVNSLKNSSHYRTLTRFWLPPTPLWPHYIQQDYLSFAEMGTAHFTPLGSDFVLANSQRWDIIIFWINIKINIFQNKNFNINIDINSFPPKKSRSRSISRSIFFLMPISISRSISPKKQNQYQYRYQYFKILILILKNQYFKRKTLHQTQNNKLELVYIATRGWRSAVAPSSYIRQLKISKQYCKNMDF